MIPVTTAVAVSAQFKHAAITQAGLTPAKIVGKLVALTGNAAADTVLPTVHASEV